MWVVGTVSITQVPSVSQSRGVGTAGVNLCHPPACLPLPERCGGGAGALFIGENRSVAWRRPVLERLPVPSPPSAS